MVDSKKQKKELHELALIYQTNKDERTLIKLNKLMWDYLMVKTYRVLTDDITLYTRKIVATDVITKLIVDIDKLKLSKYIFPAILAQTFKQHLIKYYKKESKYVLYGDNSFMEELQIKRQHI